jgi:acyl-CoA synthetase (NDP forming)
MSLQEIKAMIAKYRETGQKFLGGAEVKKILNYYGIPIVNEGVATSVDEAVKLSDSIGYPVVLKIISPDVSHKTEAQAVRLNLQSSTEVKKGCLDLLQKVQAYTPGAKVEGYLVQEMVEDGIETIIGLHTDPTFGPVLMFGLGGIWVELLKDISFRIIPIERLDAIDMVEEIRGYSLLKGFRGKPPVDMEATYEILLSVSRLGLELKEIREMDLNPVFLKGMGAVVADSRILINTEDSGG